MKFATLILAAMFMFSAGSAHAVTVGFVTGAGGLGDESFNDMTYAGLRKAQKEHDFRLLIKEPDGTGKNVVGTVADLVKQSDIIIFLGAQHQDKANSYAPVYPQKKFLLFEAVAENAPNVASIMFSQHEGSYLAGALAALVSKTGRVGFIGGADVPPVRSFLVGYTEGVKRVRPDAEVMDIFLSGKGDFSGFNKPEKGYAEASAMFEKGVDIVFAVAGLSGNGVIEAARRNEKLAIGVDSDQDAMAKGFVLTSMVKRLDTAVYEEVTGTIEQRFTPGVHVYGLKKGGVSLTPMKYTRQKLPAGTMDKLALIQDEVTSGKVVVTNILSK